MLVRRRARSPTSLHRGRCAARLDDWRLAESRATRAAATRLVVPQQPPQSQPDHGHNQPWITTAEVCAAPFGSPARLPFKNFSDARLARATRRFSERRFSAPNQQWITTAEVCAATFGEFRVGSVARRPARRADRPRARSIGVLADGRRGLAVLAQPCAAVGGEVDSPLLARHRQTQSAIGQRHPLSRARRSRNQVTLGHVLRRWR